MKPRPIYPTCSLRKGHSNTFANLQCHRSIHVRAIAPVRGCQIQYKGAQFSVRHEALWIEQQNCSRGYASTSTASAKKSQHRATAIAPPPARGSALNVPAKPTYSSKLAPRGKPTTTVLARSPAPSATTTAILRANDKLNPPQSTYAPEVSVPARGSDQSYVSWLWKTGRAYGTFYKTGLKNVWNTSKVAKELRAKVAKAGPGKDASEVLTRAEWQIVRRSRRDMLRLPAMGVLVLLLGEWLPLVVLYLTPLIPEACRIPQQVQRDLRKREELRQKRLNDIALNAVRIQMKDKRPTGSSATGMPGATDSSSNNAVSQGQLSSKTIKALDMRMMTLFELMTFAAQHGCYSKIWDWSYSTPPKFLLQRNVRKKLKYLIKDDALIERDGGFAGLGKEEVTRACVERGLPVLGKSEGEMRKSLALVWKA